MSGTSKHSSSSGSNMEPSGLLLCDLPSAELQLIPAQIPLADRFQHAALTCKALHQAVLASVALQLKWSIKSTAQQAAIDSFQPYLAKHGQHLTRLQVANASISEPYGPDCGDNFLAVCDMASQREQLRAEMEGKLLLNSLALVGEPAVPLVQPVLILSDISCSNLRELDLEHCKLKPATSSSSSSSRSTSSGSTIAATGSSSTAGDQLGLLYQLPHLSRLKLSSCGVVRRRNPLGATPLVISPSSTSQLSVLTALRSLSLSEIVLEPSVLSSLPQLEDLSLQHVRTKGRSFVHKPPPGAGSSCVRRQLANSDPANAAELMSALATLTQLTSLSLHNVGVHWPEPSAVYTALTASSASRLQRLYLHAHTAGVAPDFDLRTGVWQHSAGIEASRCLQHLTHWNSLGAGEMDESALTRLASLAPYIQQLSVEVYPSTNLSVLQPLSALESLTIRGRLDFSPPCPDLHGLTALTGLSHLGIEDAVTSVQGRERLMVGQQPQLSQQFGGLKEIKVLEWAVSAKSEREWEVQKISAQLRSWLG